MAQDDSIQNTRYHFESSGLPGVLIEPVSVQVFEALSEPYGAELVLRVGDPQADLALLLGNDCVLTIHRPGGVTRRLCGLVRAVQEGDLPGETARARVVVVPGLWFLSRRRDTRIFQDKTVPEILEAVLGGALAAYGRGLRSELEGTYPTREHCVQYGESDLDFAHRLMEEEGIFYTFDHEGEQETVLLLDSNAGCVELPTLTDDGMVKFRPHTLQLSEEPVHLVHRAYRDGTTSVVVRDWDWTRASMVTLEAEARGEDEAGRDRESFEHGLGRSLTLHEYHPRAYGAHDGKSQAAIRRAALRRDEVVLHGIGRAVGMSPGLRFMLADHPLAGMDGEYLITRVQHENRPAEELLDGDGRTTTDLYRNVFECIPLDTPFRPQRTTDKPVVHGIQTGVVTGPPGEEIHVDEHGRIKVKFHWDRLGANDETSSCWIRVEQAWAGPSWGFWWVPRIGMEVVIQFVDGDPDRPLVTGCVYNGSNATPYALPGDKTKSTIKSNSSPGGGGFNEFRFEDLAGSEEIYTHAQKDYDEVVENDHTTRVHHDQTIAVDNDQTQHVGHDQVETVHGDQRLTVDADRTVQVKANFEETIDGTETRTVAGDVRETFDANEDRTIAGDVTETIGLSETRTVSGNQAETIQGNQKRQVGAASTVTISGSLSQTATGGFASQTPALHTVTAIGGYKVTTPAAITLTAPGGVVVLAPGGVQHIDSQDVWIGGLKFDCGGFGWGVFAIKMETTGVSIGTTGFKAEFGALAIETAQSLFVEESKFHSKLTPAALAKRVLVSFKGFKEEG